MKIDLEKLDTVRDALTVTLGVLLLFAASSFSLALGAFSGIVPQFLSLPYLNSAESLVATVVIAIIISVVLSRREMHALLTDIFSVWFAFLVVALLSTGMAVFSFAFMLSAALELMGSGIFTGLAFLGSRKID